MAVLHEAQQGSVQVGPQGILVLPSVQHRQKPSEEVQRRCWDLPACSLESLFGRELGLFRKTVVALLLFYVFSKPF